MEKQMDIFDILSAVEHEGLTRSVSPADAPAPDTSELEADGSEHLHVENMDTGICDGQLMLCRPLKKR